MEKKVNWNITVRLPGEKIGRKNGKLLPNNIRCLIVGPSGCGKTTLMVDNFILSPGWLDLEDRYLYVYSKSLDQHKYVKLRELLEHVGEKIGTEVATFCNTADAVEQLDDCKENSVVIFDDFILENQDKVREYFTRGRHKGIECFYLAQTYSKVPKQLVRDNVNLLCIYKQDKTNLQHLYDEFINCDMSYDSFVEICRNCWKKDFGFITVDLTRKLNGGKYRDKIKEFIVMTC